MVIGVICPSRNNPQALFEAVMSFNDTKSELDTKFIATLDENDRKLHEYIELLEDVPCDLIVVPRDQTGSMNKALNYAAAERVDSCDVLGFIGDDHRFRTKGWDRMLASAFDLIGGGFIYGDDLAQRENLPTQVFISSSIVKALGWFGLPDARHLYLDNTWKTLGEKADCLYYLPDIVIEHMHPAYGKAQWDENHVRVNSAQMYDHDREVFEAWLASGIEQDIEHVRAAIARP